MTYTDDYKEALLEAVHVAALPKGPSSDYGTRTDWGMVQTVMNSKYPDMSNSREGLRSMYRRLRGSGGENRARPFSLRLLDLINSKRTVEACAEALGKSTDDIMVTVELLQGAGYRGVTVWEENGMTYIHNIKRPRSSSGTLDFSDLWSGNTIRFGVVSDTHMGSKFEALKELHKFYDYLEYLGISDVYHVGDISEGYYSNRPTSIFETHAVGFTEQVRHIVKNYPRRDGITTGFITGNHDATHFRNGFANIGEEIAERREDLVYLGHNFKKVHLTPNLSMSLVHPTDGVTQSLSLKLQQIIDRNDKRRADIMLVGHYHKSCNVKYHGVYGYLVPSFQHITPFMEDNNLQSDVAGMVFTVRVDDDGKMLSISTEYIDLS